MKSALIIGGSGGLSSVLAKLASKVTKRLVVVSYGCNKRRMEEVFIADMKSGCPKLRTSIFRPGHIYGPGFLLGCFPENSRQKKLPDMALEDGIRIHLRSLGYECV